MSFTTCKEVTLGHCYHHALSSVRKCGGAADDLHATTARPGRMAKAESDRIAATLRPALVDAAKAAKWGRFQASARWQAQKSAREQADKAEAAQAEARRLQAENQHLIEHLRELGATHEGGLSDDQVDELIARAHQMRREAQLAAGQRSDRTVGHTADNHRLTPGE
jgi:hypothetical protein